jgi:hypothetical protein
METIELELSNDELLQLAMQAHKQEITLNQHIQNILQRFVDEHEENSFDDCDDGYSFKTAGWGTDEDYGGSHEPI